MPRYFERFSHLEPMKEISEAEVRAREWHLEEVPGPPLHYRQFRGGVLQRVIYPEQDPAVAAADYRTRYRDVPMDAYSPVERREKTRWRVWYFDKAGTMEKSVGFEEDAENPNWREFHYAPDGALRHSIEHVYDDEGLLELVTYDPAGKVIRRQDAD